MRRFSFFLFFNDSLSCFFVVENTTFRSGVLLSAACLSFPSSTEAQTASSRPAVCLEPRLCRVQTAERSGSTPPLPPLSSLQLGSIILLLCVSVMGKRAHITTGEELADNYMGWRGAKTHSGQITQATTEDMRGGPN